MNPRPCHLAIPLVLLLPSGCLALAVGAAATYGVISYSSNEAYQDFHTDLNPTWTATVAAMRAQGYEVPSEAKPGATEGHLRSGEVEVDVERHPGPFTRVRVRVGTFDTDDHLRRAKLLLEDIAGRLGG